MGGVDGGGWRQSERWGIVDVSGGGGAGKRRQWVEVEWRRGRTANVLLHRKHGKEEEKKAQERGREEVWGEQSRF